MLAGLEVCGTRQGSPRPVQEWVYEDVWQTQTALNIMSLLTHAHSMCASTQLVFLLLGLLVQTYVVRVAHVA